MSSKLQLILPRSLVCLSHNLNLFENHHVGPNREHIAPHVETKKLRKVQNYCTLICLIQIAFTSVKTPTFLLLFNVLY